MGQFSALKKLFSCEHTKRREAYRYLIVIKRSNQSSWYLKTTLILKLEKGKE